MNNIIMLLFALNHYIIVPNLNVDSLNKQQVINRQKTIELRVDPNFSTTIESFNTPFISQKFIQLETNKNCEISAINDLKMSSNNIYILDEILNTLFIFDKKGNFINKINAKNSKIEITKFSINDKHAQLKIEDRHSPYFHYFDLNGNFIKKEERTTYYVDDFTLADFGEIIYNGFVYKDNKSEYSNNFLKLKSYNQDGGQKDIFPNDFKDVDRMDIFEINTHFSYNTPNKVTFVKPLDNSIYEIDSLGNIKEKFKFIFPLANSIPNDFLTNAKYNEKKQDFIVKNPSIIYGLENVFYTNKWITFKIRQYNTMLLNLESLELFSLNNSFVSFNGSLSQIPYNNILAIDDNHIVTVISNESLIYEKKKYNTEKLPLPEDLQNLKTSAFENPTLVFSKIKE